MNSAAWVRCGDKTVRRGSRVRILPRGRGDIMDTVLAGRIGRVHDIDRDDAGRFFLAVVLDDDTGHALGQARTPGHRFFFSIDDVDPVLDLEPAGGAVHGGQALTNGR
jgi:hypothetical protein